MPANRNALIRYKTIDKCLRNRYRRWTLQDLVDACSDALYEYEGIEQGVSVRTVQLDIQMMRSEKLGYEAPIEVYERKFYRYADPEYSITQIPLTDYDLQTLNETVQILREFKDFSLFKELGGVIQRLEDRVLSEKSDHKGIIHLDKNEQLKGLEHLDTLYQAILKQKVLEITYQSFKAREASDLIIHPQLLKEFNNRWFLLGLHHKNQKLLTLALDRVLTIEVLEGKTYVDKAIDGDEYYQHVVGVTVNEQPRVRRVTLKVDARNAPYVLTKPLHASQEVVEKTIEGAIVRIDVQHNFELERLILGFGDGIEVLKPAFLRRRIKNKLRFSLSRYEKDGEGDVESTNS
ncbi:MAG: WYL domain-containing protein [Bacteroidota bacterium]